MRGEAQLVAAVGGLRWAGLRLSGRHLTLPVRLRAPGGCSRLQAGNRPLGRVRQIGWSARTTGENAPVVHPVLHALPELDLEGTKQIPAPRVRPLDRAARKLRLDILIALLKNRPAAHRLGLMGGDRPDLRTAGTLCEIGIRLFRRDLFDNSPHAHLAAELVPRKHE